MATRNQRMWTANEVHSLRTEKLDGESWSEFRQRKMPYRTAISVKRKAGDLKIKCANKRSRIHSYNENIWETFTPESCYWAGFIAADGCVSKEKRCDLLYYFGLSLQESDAHHVEKFIKFCEFTGSSSLRKNIGKYNSNTSHCRVNISVGPKWVSDLKNNFSITERKTFTLQPPNIIDEYLMDCFIIGYIDGDGCIYSSYRNGGEIDVKVTGASRPIMEWIMNRLDSLSKECYIRKCPPKRLTKDHDHLMLSFGGYRAFALIDYFKTFPVPKLNRKWNKEAVIKIVESKKNEHPECFLDNHPHYIRNTISVNSNE